MKNNLNINNKGSTRHNFLCLITVIVVAVVDHTDCSVHYENPSFLSDHTITQSHKDPLILAQKHHLNPQPNAKDVNFVSV